MNYAGAGLLILSSDLSSILLARDARTHKWGFPKGHREIIDSSDLETAIRECREETGLLPEDYAIRSDGFKIGKGSQSYIFRYATLVDDRKKNKIQAPTYEISALQWIPIQQLLEASNVLDGNKYLRTWISDLQTNASKKTVHLFKALCPIMQQQHETPCINAPPAVCA